MSIYIYVPFFLENISKSRPKLCHKLQQCFLLSFIIADHSVVILKWPFQCFQCTCIKYYCACLLIRKQNWGTMIRSISIFHSQVLYLLHPPPPTLCLLVFCWNCFGISPRYLCICIFIRSFTLPLKSTLHKVQGQSEITVQAKNFNPSQVRLLLQTTRLTLFVDITTTRLEFNIYQDIRLPWEES